MTVEQTTKTKDDVLAELLDVYWTYSELLALLPDGSCRRLLGLVNDRFTVSLKSVTDVIDVAPDLIPDRSLSK